jgi:hypothetical protein
MPIPETMVRAGWESRQRRPGAMPRCGTEPKVSAHAGNAPSLLERGPREATRHPSLRSPLGSRGFAPRGTAALRQRLRRLLFVGLRPIGRLPRGFFLDGGCALVPHFLLSSWLFLQKSAPVLCRLPGVFIKTLALRVSAFLQSFPAHSSHPRGRHLPGQELIKKRGTRKVNPPRKKFSKGRNLSNPVNF